MRAWSMAGMVLVGLAWTAPVSAQLCLGRSFAGELSVATDVAVIEDVVAARISLGDELDSGFGWRVGLVGSQEEAAGWEAQAGQVELFWSVPVARGVHVCPGVSGLRTFPGFDDGTGLIDLFTAVGHEVRLENGGVLVPFIAPHLLVVFAHELAITEADYFPSADDPGVYEAGRTPVVELNAALTGGVAVLVGPFSLRALVTGIGIPGLRVEPAVGLGVGWRPGWRGAR